jgi:hypothetical protein
MAKVASVAGTWSKEYINLSGWTRLKGKEKSTIGYGIQINYNKMRYSCLDD